MAVSASQRFSRWSLVIVSALFVGVFSHRFSSAQESAGFLERILLSEDPAALANEALESGDAQRGAVAFYQSTVGCARCHTSDDQRPPIGPDLSRWEKQPTTVEIIQSILRPSASIREGYETALVVDADGIPWTGLLLQELDDRLDVRDVETGQRREILKSEIESWRKSSESVMPAGMVNQLGTRQQFLDLVRYLHEIATHGPTRALELRPPVVEYAVKALPEYESHVDHSGMIRSLDAASFERGKAIYARMCANCHGTVDREGSLPTSRRFGDQPLKNGHDPYSIYQTLTRGFGMMVPQTWMVPQQKYDVIHYLREEFLRTHNPSQYFDIRDSYLASLPAGDTRGPEPSVIEPWATMDYGPSLIHTYEAGTDGTNLAYKGIAIRLDAGPGGVSRGNRWMIFEHDTMRAAAGWTGTGFIDWHGVQFDGMHEIHPRLVGKIHWQNKGLGWAEPGTNSFNDPRILGRDGRRYGPLPREWARFRGTYQYGSQTLIAYRIGETDVLELPGYRLIANEDRIADELGVFTRTLQIGPRSQSMLLQVVDIPEGYEASEPEAIEDERGKAVVLSSSDDAKSTESAMIAGIQPTSSAYQWHRTTDGKLQLRIAAGAEPLRFTVWLGEVPSDQDAHELARAINIEQANLDLTQMTAGGPPRWPERLETKLERSSEEGPFAVDLLTHPQQNPWLARVRCSGLDFYPDGNSMAVCTWDGDVWLVSGIASEDGRLTWQRIASGLYQPLGLKLIEEKIYVACRDQIVILHDLNDDGETDFYENFNSDHQVTDHFHEFAMDLQTDQDGNLYYTKAARHALTAVVPQHGTLLRVSPDGSRTDILATGFRAPNGVCLNPDGTFFVTDQEGHWIPKNRINLVRTGGFYGNMFGFHNVTDPSDAAMEQPLCWITNAFDRSPAELLWVNSKSWGPLNGSLINLSYGYGKIFVVLHEKVGDQLQGGMCQLPIAQVPTGLIRGRFHPATGDLFTCGMFAWASNQEQEGGLYRVRATGRPLHVPIALKAYRNELVLTFASPVDRRAACDPSRYAVRVWSLERSQNYGSKHINEHPLTVVGAQLDEDRRTVRIEVNGLEPTWCMSIRYDLKAEDQSPIIGEIHNTIHQLNE